MTDEQRDADALREHIEGQGAPPEVGDADAVGLIQHAGGAADPEFLNRAWARIAAEAKPPGQSRRRWAYAALAMAAAITIAVGISMMAPPTVPPGPTTEEQQAALSAMTPGSERPLSERTAALRQVAARERARLVAGMVR